jgi:enediyne polyketide synthase
MDGTRIAIVGMACRYPDADNPAELWQTVLGRRRAFRAIPEGRLSGDYIGSPDDPDRTYVTHAGVLRDWQFDRPRFGVPGPLYRAADQTHWLALQVAAEALADAGFPDGVGLDRDTAGVVLGNSLTGEFTRAYQLRLRWPFVHRAVSAALESSTVDDQTAAALVGKLEALVKQPFPVPGDESLAGALANTIAGRICNQFDFHGTGYTVDGACSSSLLAVMTASRALITGELDFALAGGVDLSLDPFELVGFARIGALAVDEMRVYDANPTGFLPGEGCGVVALMRADDAERAGLRSYAELIGWGMSSDGAGGLTRPEASGQARALHRAYRMSGIGPDSVDLIEGHGTGTTVGDETELTVLRTIFADRSRSAALGSIKANIGHTKAAAGVAGLLKATLAVHHRVLPPTTGCAQPHELLRGRHVPIRIQSEPEPWPVPVPVAAVSAMGFGGINAHMLVRGERVEPTRSLPPQVRAWSRRTPVEEIVFCSAGDVPALAERLDRIVAQAGSLSAAELHDLAATTSRTVGADAGTRCALVARTPNELVTVAAKARNRLVDGPLTLIVDDVGFALSNGVRDRVGLLFPGQAAPVRARLAAWPAVAVPPLPATVRVTDGDTDTAVAQPAVRRQSLAGLAWLDQLGCNAVGAVGHSLGEISALVWSGALSPTDGLALAVVRGTLMSRHGTIGTAMASIAAGADMVSSLLCGTTATIAGLNSPLQTTIAGPDEAVAEVVRRARGHGLSATQLRVSHGFHSSAMAGVEAPLAAALSEFEFAAPKRPVFSTVTGGQLDPAADLPGLLVRQLVQPVGFVESVASLAAGCDLLVEVGPGVTLSRLAVECGVRPPAVAMDCGGDFRRFTMATAALVAAGAAELTAWYGTGGHRILNLDRPLEFLTNPCDAEPATSVVVPAQRSPEVVLDAEPTNVTGDDPVTVLRDHLSRTLELPVESIDTDSSLLTDLHLSSLQLIDVMSAVAALLGKQPPSQDQISTGASVQELAKVIAERPQADSSAEEEARGVRDWVRAYQHRWVPDEHDGSLLSGVIWGTAPGDADPHGEPVPRGLVVELRETVDRELAIGEVATAIRRISEVRPRILVVLHDGHPAAAGLARSVAAELPECAVTVVDRPAGHEFDVMTAASTGYLELRVGRDGRYERLVTQPHLRGREAGSPLGPGDVCLVTGGTTGITARCASALAERVGAVLVVLGRSPADSPEVVAGLAQLGGGARYIRCDVTDPADVRAAIAAAATRGPVRGLLHGAGLNTPRLLGDVTAATLRDTVWPKAIGLRQLLHAVGDQLRLVLAFGSVIGRTGIVGAAEYCIANDWMRHDMERWAVSNPGCRAHLLEWSVWAEVGMGERLGAVDRLRGQGVTPIAPEYGVAALLDLLADRTAAVTTMLTSRFPAVPTLSVPERADTGPLRFAEVALTTTPAVETVCSTDLSLGTDPYLDDHRVDNRPMLPAVLGLEAMAQAATTLGGERAAWSFTGVDFAAPVIVPERGSRSVRVAALAGDQDDSVDLVLRCDADGYTTDRFAATIRPAPPAPAPVRLAAAPAPLGGVHPFYGPLLFHRGRFQRLIRYDRLTAFEVLAWIEARSGDRWLSDYHGQRLLLGDPGVHDAALHVLLACVPHRRALPVGVDRVTFWRRPAGVLQVRARERSHTADDYVFDFDVVAADGAPVSSWEGLRLHATGPRDWQDPLPLDLVGPLLSRRLIELGVSDRTELTTLASTGTRIGLIAAGDPGVVLEYEFASDTANGQPSRLADQLLAALGEQPAVTASRVRLSTRALGLRGDAADDRLAIEQITDDGLVLLRVGDRRVITARIATEEAAPLVTAIVPGGAA